MAGHFLDRISNLHGRSKGGECTGSCDSPPEDRGVISSHELLAKPALKVCLTSRGWEKATLLCPKEGWTPLMTTRGHEHGDGEEWMNRRSIWKEWRGGHTEESHAEKGGEGRRG